jgi:hypothetical protein
MLIRRRFTFILLPDPNRSTIIGDRTTTPAPCLYCTSNGQSAAAKQERLEYEDPSL